MGIFDAFAAAGGATLSIDELNEKTKGDKDMLGMFATGILHLQFVNANGTLQFGSCVFLHPTVCSPRPKTSNISPRPWRWDLHPALLPAR